jgi:type II secretory pathway component PulC
MKELFTKIKDKLKSLIPFRKLNPHTYWNSLLYIFCVIIILLILFSLYILYEIKNQQILQMTPVSSKSSVLIDEKLLNKVNESFENNLAKEKEVENNTNPYKDPSVN